jgi:hypothetical protein
MSSSLYPSQSMVTSKPDWQDKKDIPGALMSMTSLYG